MYATDWSGKYPVPGLGGGMGIESLTPNYLKTIPDCPAAGSVTYQARFDSDTPGNPDGFTDYYIVWCSGNIHAPVGVPHGFPRYDCIEGLVKRPGEDH